MKAEPLKKELYEQAKELGISKLILEFEGGSDEGYLYVHTEIPERLDEMAEDKQKAIRKLESDTDEWVWTVYEYSGAGDGNRYGDVVTYNIEKGTVSTQEWYNVAKYEEETNDTLETL